jgi:tetratricopeptide (TPR) repeat protein
MDVKVYAHPSTATGIALMSYRIRSVFVSATTHDLGTYRQEVSRALLTAEVLPIVQEYFSPDYRTILELLREKIQRCDAVICLVGFAYGAEPPESVGNAHSYTQLEYLMARELGKPLYLFIASHEYVPDQPLSERMELRERQLRFRNELECGAQLWTPFSSSAQLRQQVADMLQNLPRATAEKVLDLHPAVRPAWFAGREVELAQLTSAALCATPSTISIVGVGGQGKTTLVSHWLELAGRPRFDAVFRVTAYRGGYHFDNFLDEALEFLSEGSFHKRDSPEVAERSRLLLKMCQQRQVLLVIDGIERWLAGWNSARDDLHRAAAQSDRTGHFEGLDDFLQEMAGLATGSHLVLTTRALPRALDNVHCAMVPVDSDGQISSLQGLQDESAVALMRKLEVIGDDESILTVARSYQNHPLALTVLGGLLKKRFGGRLERLNAISALDPKEHLFELFNVTRASLPRRAEAERVLQVASHCLVNPSLTLIQAGLGGEDCDGNRLAELLDLTVMLADWNLVQWDGMQEVMVLHPLIREYFSGLASDSVQIHNRLSNWYATQLIADNAYTLKDIKTRILAIEHAWRAGNVERCADLVFSKVTCQYQLCDWFAMWGHQAVAAELLGRITRGAPAVLRHAFGPPCAAMLRQLGRLDEASQLLGEVIEALSLSMDSVSLEARLQLARAFVNRGNVRRQQREFCAAIADFDQACDIAGMLSPFLESAELLSAKAHANRGNSLDEIGQVTNALADYAFAIHLYNGLAAAGSEVERLLLNVRLSRANVLCEIQCYAESIQLYDQVIAAYHELLDRGFEEFRPQWAHAHTMRGFAIADSGKSAEALPDYNLAVCELARLVQEGRRDLEQDLGLAFMNRSLAYIDLEQWAEAFTDCNQAIAVMERLYSDGRLHVAGWLAHALINRSEALVALERYDEAAQDRRRGFDAFRQMAGLNSAQASMVFFRKLLTTARILWKCDPSESSTLLKEAFDLCVRKLEQAPENEAFVLEVHRGIVRWVGREDDLAQAGIDLDRVRSLLPPLANR